MRRTMSQVSKSIPITLLLHLHLRKAPGALHPLRMALVSIGFWSHRESRAVVIHDPCDFRDSEEWEFLSRTDLRPVQSNQLKNLFHWLTSNIKPSADIFHIPISNHPISQYQTMAFFLGYIRIISRGSSAKLDLMGCGFFPSPAHHSTYAKVTVDSSSLEVPHS